MNTINKSVLKEFLNNTNFDIFTRVSKSIAARSSDSGLRPNNITLAEYPLIESQNQLLYTHFLLEKANNIVHNITGEEVAYPLLYYGFNSLI